ncbi:cation:proton antiporter [Mobilibacterium timonense]|uniref:cation:proton antiporter n=1 Tax=Mobilibacterium timonense TaxID=1871012 RepID=UPI0023539C92|nr:cation:proton antiporter [Mobilibacterium timonense]
MSTLIMILGWVCVLALGALLGKLISKLRLPAILGWLIAGMIFGPFGLKIMSQDLMDHQFYIVITNWMQVAFGLMLGTELVWRKIREFGRALMATTLTQSLGTFAVVSAAFMIIFRMENVPVFLGLIMGSIALATAPAPALSIVREFHTRGPVTDTLLPMAVLDDVVGIVVFFSVNAAAAHIFSGTSSSAALIPVMLLLPVAEGILPGVVCGKALRKLHGKKGVLFCLLSGITASYLLCWGVHTFVAPMVPENYMMTGVVFSTVFSNMVSDVELEQITSYYSPVLGLALLISIVNLGAPLDFHLILGSGIYTLVYIVARAAGKYFGARIGSTSTKMPRTVQKYLGFTLLPHSGVSLVFTGIACATLAGYPELVQILRGTIAAAAVVNEIIAVIAAREGFRLAGEIRK